MTPTTPTKTWYHGYLTDRGISPDVAARYGWRILHGSDIDAITARKNRDGACHGAGVYIPYRAPDGRDLTWRIRYQRPAVRVGSDDYDGAGESEIWSAIHGTPENDTAGDREPRYMTGRVPENPGYHEVTIDGRTRLWRRRDDGTVARAYYYPMSIPAAAEKLAARYATEIKSQKFTAPLGVSQSLYIPEPILGGRPLLILEGETRVMACLSADAAEKYDLIGLAGSRVSPDLVQQLRQAAEKASDVVIVLDADATTNPDVGCALLRLVRELTERDDGKPTKSRKIRVGVPGSAQRKEGLDDYLGRTTDKAQALARFVRDALPADPWQAVADLREDQHNDFVRVARGTDPTHIVCVCARDRSLPEYEKIRRALGEFGAPPIHPQPEGRLHAPKKGAPTPNDVSAIVADYVAPAIPYVSSLTPKGQRQVWKVVGTSLVRSQVDDAPTTAVRDRLAVLMPMAPATSQVSEAMSTWAALPPAAPTIHSIRRPTDPADRYALCEVPAPTPGPAPAWREFLSRCSCQLTVLAWIWSVLLPAGTTGRQILYVHGPGATGKSTVRDVLIEMLGGISSGVAVTLADIKSDSDFALEALTNHTRLLVLDEVRSPTLLHYRTVRDLAAGAPFEAKRKYRQSEQERYHPRMLVLSNSQLKYDTRTTEEVSRVLQVDVASTKARREGWREDLIRELPQLLHAAKAAYQLLWDRNTSEIRLTPATRQLMENASTDVMADTLGPVLDQIIVDPDGFTPTAKIDALAARYAINPGKAGNFQRENLNTWIGARAKQDRRRLTPKGNPVRGWVGISLADLGGVARKAA